MPDNANAIYVLFLKDYITDRSLVSVLYRRYSTDLVHRSERSTRNLRQKVLSGNRATNAELDCTLLRLAILGKTGKYSQYKTVDEIVWLFLL